MESLKEKEKEVEFTLTDKSNLSLIQTIKIKYCPANTTYSLDARIGLIFVIPSHLKASIIPLIEDQLNKALDNKGDEFFLSVPFHHKPSIFSLPLSGLNILKGNKFITEQFRQEISKEYTEILTNQLELDDLRAEKKNKPQIVSNSQLFQPMPVLIKKDEASLLSTPVIQPQKKVRIIPN